MRFLNLSPTGDLTGIDADEPADIASTGERSAAPSSSPGRRLGSRSSILEYSS